MWIFRRAVANLAFRPHPDKIPRQAFEFCLRELREPGYLDWLRGRVLNERDRAPAYGRIKKLMLLALRKNAVKRTLPSPAWAP